jgi:acyl dehydratase
VTARAATGAVLPELVIDVTPTFVVASAIATRDFQDVHHDRDQAVARGSQDIFLNILTTTGLVQRYVTDWAGPQALVRTIAIRLGAPCYAGDTLTFSGKVAESAAPGDSSPGANGEVVVEVAGRCRLGDHVTGTVRVVLPVGQAPSRYEKAGSGRPNGTFVPRTDTAEGGA